MKNITPIDITADEIWNLRKYTDDDADEYFADTISNLRGDTDEDQKSTMNFHTATTSNLNTEHQNQTTKQLETETEPNQFFFDANNDLNEKSVYGKAIHLSFDKDHFIRSGKLKHMLEQVFYNQLIGKKETKIFEWGDVKIENKTCNNYGVTLVNFENEDKSHIHQLHKARPSKINYEKYVLYFAYKLIPVIRETFKRTTQLATLIANYLMVQHFKSKFQMLRRPKRNEVVCTDTHFSNVKSIKSYWCSQFFWRQKSNKIYVIIGKIHYIHF